MPSSVAHALTAVAIGTPLAPAKPTVRYWIAGILCAVLLDVDAIGRPFGMGDIGWLGGHRALTHSLIFAVVLGVAVTWVFFRAAEWEGTRARIAAFLVLATAAHGLLDTFAEYGRGVTLLFPFSSARYAAPVRPLAALNEVLWVWLPASVAAVGLWWWRRRGGAQGDTAA